MLGIWLRVQLSQTRKQKLLDRLHMKERPMQINPPAATQARTQSRIKSSTTSTTGQTTTTSSQTQTTMLLLLTRARQEGNQPLFLATIQAASQFLNPVQVAQLVQESMGLAANPNGMTIMGSSPIGLRPPMALDRG